MTVARIPVETHSQVDLAVHAERRDGLTGLRVDLLEEVVRAEDQAAVRAILALPVVHAAPVETLNPFVDPDFFARRRVQRHERAVRAKPVDDAAHDERIEVGLA